MSGSELSFVFGNPIAPLVTNANFLTIEYGIFHGIPAKESTGANIEDAPVMVGCKKKTIEIYLRARSAETNTFSVHNANIKGKMIWDVKFELSTSIYIYIDVTVGSNRVRNRVNDRVL